MKKNNNDKIKIKAILIPSQDAKRSMGKKKKNRNESTLLPFSLSLSLSHRPSLWRCVRLSKIEMKILVFIIFVYYFI